jgi:hypothetical protein
MCQALIASAVPSWPANRVLSTTPGPMAKEVYAGKAVGRDEMANLVEGDLGNEPTPFTLEVTGYTSPAEVERYVQILKTRGQDGLLQVLSSQNLGYFQLSGQPQRTVIFAQQSQDETSRTITVLCRRWLNKFIEGFEQRAPDFPFAFVELSIARTGKGQGTMFTAAKVKFAGPTGNIVGVACSDARVEFPNKPESTIKAGTSIGVQDYANNWDWLQEVRLQQTSLVQVHR